MGFFGALGGAMKAPLKPINKAVSKVPGMQTLGKPLGMAQPNQGVGPSNPMLSKFGMLGQKMNQPSAPQMGASMGQAPPPSPDPATMGYQAPDLGNASPDVMPQSGIEAPIPPPNPEMNQGLAPSPRMMQRRPMMNPRMMNPRQSFQREY